MIEFDGGLALQHRITNTSDAPAEPRISEEIFRPRLVNSPFAAVSLERIVEATAGYAGHAPIYNKALIAVAIP